MRCFVGIELPSEFVALARVARETVVGLDPQWSAEKWVPDENLHVTVAFLGEVEDAALATLIEAMQGISTPRFELTSPSLVAVPDWHRARMCWLEFEDATLRSGRLADEVNRLALASGIAIEAETRRYRPHVTLVRSRRGRRLSASARDVFRERSGTAATSVMSVAVVTVFTSTLTTGAPVYEAVARIALEAP